MTLVVDASVIVATLVDSGTDGAWAEQRLLDGPLAAPHLVFVEAANILRRAARNGAIADEVASLAHEDLAQLRISLFAYLPFATRIWELRDNVSAYDAWYVALAERLDAPLATLDRRLASAPGPGCVFQLPPA